MEDYGGKFDKEGQFYLERIRANAQKMAELIDSLLTLSRVTRADISPVRLDLSALARQIVASLRAADPKRNVECEIADGMQAEGDAKLLEVALQNLLQNAWKFTSKRDSAHIEVNVKPLAGTNVCYVRDNGAGFDMKYASKLFLAFQRLHDVQQFEGTGIGLATVQRIIKRHGGRIWAEGQPGHGACFYFTLNGLEKVSAEAA
jgi:light-regulated signal transduction histidine kinase (bacteriophytochrome)